MSRFRLLFATLLLFIVCFSFSTAANAASEADGVAVICDVNGSVPYPDLATATADPACTNIRVFPGIYANTNAVIGHDMVIRGAGMATTLDGSLSGSVITVMPGVNVTIRTLRIIRGAGTDTAACSPDNASTCGGGIYNDGGNLIVEGVQFSGNQTVNDIGVTTSGGSGAAIFSVNGTVNARRIIASYNTAHRGGAIASINGNTDIISGTFFGNTDDAAFVAPHSSEGGAIYNEEGFLIISKGRFISNSADRGGAIRSFDSMDINSLVSVATNSRFEDNTAAEDGGAISSTDTALDFKGARFIDNSAGTDGGAVWLEGGSLRVMGAQFSGNAAVNGGAVYNDDWLGSVIEDSWFRNNSATQDGGAIFVVPGGRIDFLRGTLEANSAANDGGGVYNLGEFEFGNSTLHANTAGGNGGAVFSAQVGAFGSLMVLVNVTASDNVSAGGTIHALSGSLISVANSILIGNPSGVECGGNLPLYGDLGNNIVEDVACGVGSNVDPQLGPLQLNGGSTPTQAIPSTSPAVDGGRFIWCLSDNVGQVDQRSISRVGQDGNGMPFDGNGCDIGAFELEG